VGGGGRGGRKRRWGRRGGGGGGCCCCWCWRGGSRGGGGGGHFDLACLVGFDECLVGGLVLDGDSDGIPDLDFTPFSVFEDFGQDKFILHVIGDDGLVGLNLAQHIPRPAGVPGLLVPLADGPVGHGGGQGGHHDGGVLGHGRKAATGGLKRGRAEEEGEAGHACSSAAAAADAAGQLGRQGLCQCVEKPSPAAAAGGGGGGGSASGLP